MFHIRTLVLLGCCMLAACKNTVGIEPKDYYLPEATVGKPYRQVIHLYGSAPSDTKVKIWPEEAGLYWQFSRAHSTSWRADAIRTDPLYWEKAERGQGNAIEIIGTPAESWKKEIKIGIWAMAYSTMLSRGVRTYKEYIIKLIPDSTKPSAKP